ncbi:hypothetical protein PF005_g5994 [Phytophthora fragariae]|uniref:Carrier domain-containing protein n=1 Tax=Phytophthora fragariae TaxID=53985 RepID=A0A6A3FDC7_9STRA|nr:hypothetical protein PF009_g6672 [Phytophthora fragariae]KAE9021257.1 hypothetical protein PF011_g5032 [Phytophthora fragariae]KAE9125813.1 hypothetical protein PF007_g6231 [Phytophthora fragariae]KAE9126522.1 hypothetical protein PF010_g5250 [Phytophthora fragariae]KAE9150310.1 hypothetical protein PF006_g5312 [Phytophthora fragariae]
MSRLCQCLQRFWALHAQDEAAALIQSFKGREEVSYLQLRKWQQEVKAALGDGEWEVVGVNLTPFSIEETALVLLVAEEKRRIYVPLDTQLPVIRQLEMVRSSGVQRLVTTWDSPLAKLFASSDGRASGAVEWRTVDLKTSPFQPVQVLAFSDSWLRSQIQESLLCRVRQKLTEGDNSAPLYVLFTSGTTGKPRGVVGTRTGAWTRCEWMWTAYPFATSEDNGERVLRATKLSFVDSVWEILGAFLQRVPLVHIQQPRRHQGGNSARQDTAKSVLLDDSARFLEVMRIEQVTRFTAVPSVLEMLLLQTKETELQFGLAQLRYILSSGEILSVHAVQKLTTALPEVAILNLYGSTEVSGDVTCMELKAPMTLAQLNEWQECGIPIASLSGNGVVGGEKTSLLLVSSDLSRHTSQSSGPTPIVVWPLSRETTNEATQGILYVAGPLVSLGYISDCDEDAFVTSDALLTSHTDELVASRRWFCTGDVCSVFQGRLYFRGRKDNAVKIHGQRVYLEAVERAVAAALKETSKSSGVDDDVDSKDLSSKQVIAFTMTKEIEHYGASHAPHQVFVVSTDAVQRLSHGKVDRRALETLLSRDTGGSSLLFQSLTTDDNAKSTTERLLARILKETLDVSLSTGIPGDVRARTFREIGANSLLATLLVYELHEAFGPHPVKSHELLEMTIGEVLSSLDDLKENPGVKAFPDSTQHKPVKDWDSDSDAGSAIKRRKLVNSVCTDTARTADETTALTYVSRYNQSSLGVNGVYMPTCYASPLSSSEQTSATSLSTSWVLKRQWRVDLKKCIDASPLVIQRHDLDGAVISTWAIVGSHSGQLVCVDVQDNGREVWRVTLDDRIEASATLSVKYGLVYVGTYAGTLFALEMHSGDIRWRFRAIEAIKAAALVIDTRKLVVFGAYDSNLYGLDAVTGQRRWAIDLQGSIFSTPLYCGWSEKLFAATTRGIVVAFQFTSSTGDDVKEQWKLQLPAPVFAGLNADYASKILVAGCADGNLYGLSTDSGSMQWRLPTEKPIFSSPCVYRAGSLVFGSHDGMLRRVNSRSGELIWSTNLHGAVFASSTVVRLVGATPAQCADTLNEGTSTTDGQLVCCVATTTGRVYFCDENTGSIIYQTCESSEKASSAADTSENCSELGPLFGSPVLIDKWCLLGTRTNYFYGFELKQTSSNEN